MKIKSIKKLDVSYTQYDLATETENFYIKSGDKYLLIHNSPSLLAGWSPEDGRFFVGTKAFFNKTQKINYTPEDIDKNHGHAPGLSKKLKEALKYLPRVVNKGSIIRGDFIFSKDDVKYETIDGVKGLSFAPNAIKYFVDGTSGMFKRVQKAQMGIIWHTVYSGQTLSNLKSSFNISSSHFKMTRDVYCRDVNVTLDTLKWEKQEKDVINKNIKSLKLAVKNIHLKGIEDIDKIAGTQVSKEIMTYINTKVRAGTTFKQTEIRDLMVYLNNKYEGRKIGVSKKFKTQGTIDRKTQALQDQKKELQDAISNAAGTIHYIFKWYYNVKTIKNIIVQKLDSLKTEETPYIIQADGSFKISSPEGWVMGTGPSSGIKFVNRSVFSKQNFLNPKFK